MFCGNTTPGCVYIAHSLGFTIRHICFDKLYIMLLLLKIICFIKVSRFHPILIKFDVVVNNGWIN